MSKGKREEPGIRYRRLYDGETLYIVVCPEAMEIFISSVTQNQDHKQGAIYDALSRVVTLAWQMHPVTEVITQLHRASRSQNDLPGILSTILEEHNDMV